jgi:phosphoribosylaminoimidazole-succinocarboxamide synthase
MEKIILYEGKARRIYNIPDKKEYLLPRSIRLVDFKLEFGRDNNGKIILADEISPDTCWFWNTETNKLLDKNLFRFDLGNLIDGYNEIVRRIK